jgi:hypothetical protein
MAGGASCEERRVEDRPEAVSFLDTAPAHEANVSPRHLCFLETGRAKPSRDMVPLLADALAVPLRERNALLLRRLRADVSGVHT